MSLNPAGGRRSVSPASSGRSSPIPSVSRRAVEDGLYKADKGLRRYGAIIERALHSWDTAPQEWADYIAFLGRLLKAIQSSPKDAPLLPHAPAVASKLAQCLNPALPSGVHQKAIDVYAYIFSTYGTLFIAAHLQDFLPALTSVLSFASLSTRPAIYALFEDYIVQLSTAVLRPALKSLLLGFLPALEEETSEDFERAFGVADALRRTFSHTADADDPEDGADGYFWQCLYLCVLASPSRRQGGLNLLARILPMFTTSRPPQANDSTEASSSTDTDLSLPALAAISPEPGLLVRCFVAGLGDSQMLIQRGFLELLVGHLPLHSPLMVRMVDEHDADRLITAAIQVVLRRDMSLNRRLWSWFLGPETLAQPQLDSSQTNERQDEHSSNGSHSHLRYFDKYGRAPLERCMMRMFTSTLTSAAQVARPFRISVALMDRWEIGGSLAPRIFMSALESAYSFSQAASPNDVGEVMRSAGLFFDSVEAKLIWQTIVNLLQRAFDAEDSQTQMHYFELIQWMLANFNVNDEEMTMVHMPLTAMLLLSSLNRDQRTAHHEGTHIIGLDLAAKLVNFIPAEAISQAKDDIQMGELHDGEIDLDPRDAIARLYDVSDRSIDRFSLPLSRQSLGGLLLKEAVELTISGLANGATQHFSRATPVLLALLPKATCDTALLIGQLVDALENLFAFTGEDANVVSFSVLCATVNLLTTLKTTDRATTISKSRLEPALTRQIWLHLSPTRPKYHVEAAKLLWQLEESLAPSDSLKVSLVTLVRPSCIETGGGTLAKELVADSARCFAVMWIHSLPSPPTSSGTGILGASRRGSIMPITMDATQLSHRLDIVAEPLSLLLDQLQNPTTATARMIRTWLEHLPSLSYLFGILYQRLHASLQMAVVNDHGSHCEFRQHEERTREIVHVLTQYEDVLRMGSEWTWQCLNSMEMHTLSHTTDSGIVWLGTVCVELLKSKRLPSALDSHSIGLLDAMLTSTYASELKALDLDSDLLQLLMHRLDIEDHATQSLLLPLTTKAIRLRLTSDVGSRDVNDRSRASLSNVPSESMPPVPDIANSTASTGISPTPQLLQCLRKGFTSRSARPHMDQWVRFFAEVLPTFANAIFSNLLPLVDCLCLEIGRIVQQIIDSGEKDNDIAVECPETVILQLLEALEMLLSQAHECLASTTAPESASKPTPNSTSFLGAVSSGVFKVEGPPSRSSHANSRLTVILAFQDSIRACLSIWTWSNHYAESTNFDRTSAATMAYCAQRLRSKSRYLLEQMFAVEPLESLEVVISHWQHAAENIDAISSISLLHAMQGSRPKHTVPAVLDALCSRANPTALPPTRLSSQTVDLSPIEVTSFLLAYLDSTEDDAMDEVWVDCMAFLRDVLTNPMPYRQTLPALLSLVHLLARKVSNTNFGEQRKMRRELGEIFQRLLAAIFATFPTSSLAEPIKQREHTRNGQTKAIIHASSLAATLTTVMDDVEAILESAERVLATTNSISTGLIAPTFRAKSFPANVTSDVLALLVAMEKKAPSAKGLRKELIDVLNDPRLFMSPLALMEIGWLPVFHYWCLRDKDRMPELLSRLGPPSSAGIMFGVGATAARIESDRKTQLNLRRIALLLLASQQDMWIAHLRDFDEKLGELFSATISSSPSAATKPELFMLCRALQLSLSPVQMSPLWPTINESLQAALRSMMPSAMPSDADHQDFTNLGVLQACKLLDLLIVLSPDYFQLHEWLYITDSLDAVYRPLEWQPSAIADQIAESLGSGPEDDGQALSAARQTVNTNTTRRRPLLGNDIVVDNRDVKAMAREDFARTVLRPFLGQLSIHAYEASYSMENVDLQACRESLLEDVLDLGTVVE